LGLDPSNVMPAQTGIHVSLDRHGGIR
jgi:hypothetical protein